MAKIISARQFYNDGIREGETDFHDFRPGRCVQGGMDLRISSPCPESWAGMAGNDRVRFCGRCKLNVYNLVAMKRQEVEALVRNTNGRLCGRLYVRGDGTATVRNCAGGTRRKLVRRAVAFAGILVLGAFSWLLRGIDEPDRSVHPVWIRAVLNWIEPERRPRLLPGEISCPVPVPTPPSAPQ
jgi:hypothetical protein